MTGTPLGRAAGTAPPVRALHLGLGSFFRAHQAWYTDRADDAWGIAAFTGRRPDLALALAAQDGLYTLITRGADDDGFSVVRSVAAAHAADDDAAWRAYWASPDVRVVTLTVTEAGYRDAGPTSVARRLVGGLLARRAAGAGPVTLVPCDNLPQNGAALSAVLREAADAADPSLAGWMEQHAAVATTMVDRITPEPTEAERRAVLDATGVEDRCPVATEPFSEWVIAGEFPGGRPAWEAAGAVVTADVTPFEDRKLWLLNGAHSLLAYVGTVRGRSTVDEAIRDPICHALVERWWDTCLPHLELPADDTARYRTALLERFGNPRIRHSLEQIATDGSQKLPARILPVLRRERAEGRVPEAAARVLAAWVLHLTGVGGPVRDVRSADLRLLLSGGLRDVVPRVLGALDPPLGDDAALVAAVSSCAAQMRPR